MLLVTAREMIFETLLYKAVSILHSAVLAIVLDSTILRKAQEEIDNVIGNHRLPTFDDRPSLPYIEGIVREALR